MRKMLKKLTFLLMLIILPTYSDAQIDGFTKKHIQSDESVVGEIAPLNDKTEESGGVVAEDEDSDDIPPAKVTVEEIISLETESKKSIRNRLKNKDASFQRSVIDAFIWQERTMKIKELMGEGKSYNEAKKIAEETIKIPEIGKEDDTTLEKYIYKKGGFINQ